MDTATLSFFEQQPEALPLYEAFAGAVMDQYPDTRIKVQKSQISFSNRYLFACVSFARVKKKKELPDPYLVITLGMPYPLGSPRVAVKTEPYPGRWTTHIVIGSADEVDEELLGWVAEARNKSFHRKRRSEIFGKQQKRKREQNLLHSSRNYYTGFAVIIYAIYDVGRRRVS